MALLLCFVLLCGVAGELRHLSVPNPLRSQLAASREQWGVGGGGGSIWGRCRGGGGWAPMHGVICPGHARQPGGCLCPREPRRRREASGRQRSEDPIVRWRWRRLARRRVGRASRAAYPGDHFALSALVCFPRLPGCCVPLASPDFQAPGCEF